MLSPVATRSITGKVFTYNENPSFFACKIAIYQIFNKKIIESYVINKCDNNLKNLFKEVENKYYFGIDDDYIKNVEIPKINIKNKFILSDSKNEIDESSRYLSSWGMII